MHSNILYYLHDSLRSSTSCVECVWCDLPQLLLELFDMRANIEVLCKAVMRESHLDKSCAGTQSMFLATMTASCSLETMPVECFNQICFHVALSDIFSLAVSSKSMATLCGRDNRELWNVLLCDRMWTVDPSLVVLGQQLQDTAD